MSTEEKEQLMTIELNGRLLSKRRLQSLRFEDVSIPVGDIVRPWPIDAPDQRIRGVPGPADGRVFFHLPRRLVGLLPPPPDEWHDRIFDLALTYGEHRVFLSCQSLPMNDIPHPDNDQVEVGVYFQTSAQPFDEFVDEWREAYYHAIVCFPQ